MSIDSKRDVKPFAATLQARIAEQRALIERLRAEKAQLVARVATMPEIKAERDAFCSMLHDSEITNVALRNEINILKTKRNDLRRENEALTAMMPNDIEVANAPVAAPKDVRDNSPHPDEDAAEDASASAGPNHEGAQRVTKRKSWAMIPGEPDLVNASVDPDLPRLRTRTSNHSPSTSAAVLTPPSERNVKIRALNRIEPSERQDNSEPGPSQAKKRKRDVTEEK